MTVCLFSTLKVIHFYLFWLGSVHYLVMPCCLIGIYLNFINFHFIFLSCLFASCYYFFFLQTLLWVPADSRGPWHWACGAHCGPRLASDPLVISPTRPSVFPPSPLIPILRPLWVWPSVCFEQSGLPQSSLCVWTSGNLRRLAKVPSVARDPLWGSWAAFYSPYHTLRPKSLWDALEILCDPLSPEVWLPPWASAGRSPSPCRSWISQPLGLLPSPCTGSTVHTGWPVFHSHPARTRLSTSFYRPGNGPQ